MYSVREHDPQALSKSFDELQLFEQDQAGDIITVSEIDWLGCMAAAKALWSRTKMGEVVWFRKKNTDVYSRRF